MIHAIKYIQICRSCNKCKGIKYLSNNNNNNNNRYVFNLLTLSQNNTAS